MMISRIVAVSAVAFVALACVGAPLCAQTPADPITGALKWSHEQVKGYVTRAAEQVPEADYAFKPTPDVRSFGQLIAHIADANYAMCGAISGEKPAAESVEKTKTAKADLQKALADSFARCDKAYASVTDAGGGQAVDFFGHQVSKLGVLAFVNNHNYEHYGNIVTYMRLKGIVPPSSQPQKPAAK